MQLIKGESAYWINQQNITANKFGWQDEYFAVSVSASQVGRVRAYIKNQEEHHEKATFDQEYKKFISRYGFEKFSE